MTAGFKRFLIPARLCIGAAGALAILACGDAADAGDAMAGEYRLGSVDFHTSLLHPVPAVSVTTLGDSTVVERGHLTLGADGGATLELVYRWRYGGVPGGDTVSDTLSYVHHDVAPSRACPETDWFLLLRGSAHIAYLIRLPGGTVVLIDYDQAGTMDFYFGATPADVRVGSTRTMPVGLLPSWPGTRRSAPALPPPGRSARR